MPVQTDAWRTMATAPMKSHVLLALDTGEIVVGYWSPDPSPDGAWFFQDGLNSISPPPIAWMPLPASPVGATSRRDSS